MHVKISKVNFVYNVALLIKIGYNNPIMKGILNMKRNLKAFTLAEMMVVMLILTILLAAFAPLMTKRKSISTENPWRWATNNSDIYFGLNENQKVGIGTQSGTGKLTINVTSSSKTPAIAFVDDGDLVAGFATNSGGTSYLFKSNYSANTTGDYNTAYGYGSMTKMTSGYKNLAVGSNSLTANTTGYRNVAIGYNALNASTTAHDNTGIGTEAAAKTTTGIENTAVGSNALYSNTEGSANTAIGYKSLYNNKASRTTGIGYQALMNNTTGTENTAIGYNSLALNQTGSSNVAVGSSALAASTADYNTAVGNEAMKSTTTGGYNTTMGALSLTANTTGISNVAYGYKALAANSTGSGNTAIGTNSLVNNSSGNYNTALGYNACKNVQGSYKTCIGYDSGPTAADSTVNEAVYIGSSSLSAIYSKVSAITVYSDARLKNVKDEFKRGLEQIRGITPKYFVYKNDKDKKLRLGVIAQELQKVLPEAVEKNPEGYLVVRQEYIKYTLLNAVKQLDTIVQGLTAEIKTLVLKITGLEDRIKILEEENKKLKEQIKVINKRLDKLEQDD